MNWHTEARNSWTWLHWMREVDEQPTESVGILRELIRGLGQWNDANARERHAVGDTTRILPGEWFSYAAAMMSRAAKAAITDALAQAIAAGVDDPMSWASLPGPKRRQWETSHHVITTVLQAWITLWNDLADTQERISATSAEQVRQQWMALAEQASQIVTGAATAALAQRR